MRTLKFADCPSAMLRPHYTPASLPAEIRAIALTSLALLIPATAGAENVLLTSGVPASFNVPSVSRATLLSNNTGFRVVVPEGARQLEVRLSIPSSVQYAIGVRVGSDFSTTTFNNQWGGIGNANQVLISTTSSPPLTAGTYYIGILLLSNPSLTTATITATITSGGASISVPQSIDFGSVTAGQTRDENLRIENKGTTALTITSATVSNTQFRLVSPNIPSTIAPNAHQEFVMRYQPTAAGSHSAILTLRTDDSARPTVTVALSGRATATAPAPVILSTNGVVNGASFLPGIASGSWVSIRGTNLATGTRIWNSVDFQGDRLPLSLDGVSVKINNRDAPVYFVSPTQINVLAPADDATGLVNVTVTNALGTSVPAQAMYQQYAPAFFVFDPQNRIYPAAVHLDGTLVGRAGLFGSDATTAAARTGSRILLFGTGFGSTNPPVDPAVTFSGAARLSAPEQLRIRIGNVEANVEFAGLIGNGLYQFNIVVPDVPEGDQTLIAEIGGQRTQSTVRLTVQSVPRPQIRYPGATQQAAADCPGPLCNGSVTASPGERVEFWIAGTNLGDVTGVHFVPPDDVSVSDLQTTPTAVRAIATISPGAALGKRQFFVTSPAGDSNRSPGALNISTFRISNLRIGTPSNTGSTLMLPITFDYTDPTGAVSSGPLDIATTLAFGNTVMSSIGFNFNPEVRTPGATSGTITYTETYRNVTGTTGGYFHIRLTSKDGRESDRLGRFF